MAEQLKFLEESRSKISGLEEAIEGMGADKNSSDDVGTLEQRIQAYKSQLQVTVSYNRELLEKQGSKHFVKSENQNVQEILALNRIDDAINRAIALKLKAKAAGL